MGWEDNDEKTGGLADAAAIEASAEQLRHLHLRQPHGLARTVAAQGAISTSAAVASGAVAAQPHHGRQQSFHCGGSSSSSPPAAAWWPASGAAERQAEMEAEDKEGFGESEIAVPLGYRLVPDVERLETLSQLQHKLADLNEKYTRLPLRIETEGQRQQQQTLRNQIKDMEAAVKLFSRSGGVLVEI